MKLGMNVITSLLFLMSYNR